MRQDGFPLEVSEQAWPLCPELPAAAHDIPVQALAGLDPALAARFRRLGLATVGDLARRTEAELLELPYVGVGKVEGARRAVHRLAAELATLPPEALRDGQALRTAVATTRPLAAQVRELCAGASPALRTVVKRRALSSGPPETLEAIGTSLGLTRERVRQLEGKAWARLEPMQDVVRVADDRVARARAGRTVPLTPAELERSDPWFLGVHAAPGLLRGLFERFGARHRVVRLEAGEPLLLPATLAEPADWVRRLDAHLDARGAARGSFVEEVRAMLRVEGAPELEEAMLARLERDVPSQTSQAELVERILSELGGPAPVEHVKDLAASRFGVQMSIEAVRNAMLCLDTVRTAPSCWVLRSALAPWDKHRERVRRTVEGLLRRSRRAVWSARDLSKELRAGGAAWTRGLAPHVVEHLLLDAPGMQRLPRGLFTLGAAGDPGPAQAPLQDLVVDVLRRAGRPLPQIEVLRGVQEMRSVPWALARRWPVVRMRGGLWGLADRDLGLDVKRIGRFDRLVRAELDRTGAASPEFLAACVASTWPGARIPDPETVVGWSWPRYAARLDPSRKGLLGTAKPEEDAEPET